MTKKKTSIRIQVKMIQYYARLEKLQDTTNDVQVIRDTEKLNMF